MAAVLPLPPAVAAVPGQLCFVPELLGESRPRVEENQGTEELPGTQEGSASPHTPELPEALPGAALNKDQLNKAGALGRGSAAAAAVGYRARKQS